MLSRGIVGIVLVLALSGLVSMMPASGGSVETDIPARIEEIKKTIQEGDYGDAEARARELLAIVEITKGPASAETAMVLDQLVEALRRGGKGHAPEARKLIDRAVSIKEKALGPDHPEVAVSLNHSAVLYMNAGESARAKSLFERVIAIREKAFGANSPDVAKVLHNLAIVHYNVGEYEQSIVLYRRALAIYDSASGIDEIVICRSLNNLANALYEIGDYSGARQYAERALETSRKALGPEHPEMGSPLMNLGTIEMAIGDYVQAKSSYEAALAIFRKSPGEKHSLVPMTLHNLGALLYEWRDYEAAEPYLREALELYQNPVGMEQVAVARSLETLANVQMARGRPEEARPLYERALAIRERVLGPKHYEVAENLKNLGEYFGSQGDHERARDLFQKALVIFQEALGARHPRVGGCLVALARELAQTGEVSQSLDASLRAEEIAREHLRLMARTLAERQALRYASVRTRGLDLALSLIGSGRAPSYRRQVWDSLIHSRALVLDEVASRHGVVHGAAEIGRRAGELFEANQRLANLTVRGPGEGSPEQYRQLLQSARRDKEEAERSLAERSVAFQQIQARGPVGAAEVSVALPPGSVLVSFIRYDRYDFSGRRNQGPGPGGAVRDPSAAYLAVVTSGGQEEPRFVPIGTAQDVEALVSGWRSEAERGPFLQGRSAAAAESAYRTAAAALRRRIWDPISPHVTGASLVLVVPDGALNLVNLAALPGKKGTYLLEESFRLHYLSSEKDVVRGPEREARDRGLLAVGGPAFDEPATVASLGPGRGTGTAPVQSRPAGAATYRGERPDCGDFRSMSFSPLPATTREVEEVITIWGRAAGTPRGANAWSADVLHLTGAGANEATFKLEAPGRRVLHLATHGFFLEGRCRSVLESSRGIGSLSPLSELAPSPVAGESPLILSGLALAGANQRDAAGPDEEDGILTAEEISALDLTGTDWAVLSACDTGRGEIKAGEGVLGLRRAFQAAGVATLIMSLWSVEDEAARAWMRALYEGRFMHRLGTADSVRRAGLEVLRERREKGASTHPFYWAPFVAAGDWR